MMDLGFLRAQKAAVTPLGDSAEIQRQYRHWRMRIMVGMYLGYAVFYFCRKNLSASTPALISDLSLSKTQIGLIWSLFYLTYGVSKFFNGVIGDKANPRYFMAIGLFLSAISNILFGVSSSFVLLGLFWALNGWFQGIGWPPCARLLTHWYSQNERATQWSIWNTAHQVGGGVILILGGILTQYLGWRSSLIYPSFIALLTCGFLVYCLRDTPESLGLPPIEKFRNDEPAGSAQADSNEVLTYKEILFQRVLNNSQIWFLAIANFFVYLVRFGALDWAPTFLVEVKQSSIANASMKIAGFEFLGMAGAVLAGWLSDRYFKGRRWIVNVLYMALLAFTIAEFWLIPPGYPVLDAAALGAVGFLVYGPQMLVGVAAADIGGKNAAATATGFTGLMGYMGSIASGVGTGWIVDHYSWEGGFVFFIASAIVGALCFFLTAQRTPFVREEVLKAQQCVQT